MNIRNAMMSDIEDIIRIYESKEIFVSVARSHTAENYREYHAKGLRERAGSLGMDEDLRVFLAEEKPGGRIFGYLILMLNVTETITGEQQAYIYDYGVSRSKPVQEVLSLLLGESEKAAREGDMKYLTIEIFTQDKAGEEAFGELGFMREMSRILKRVEINAITPPTPDPFRVRRGQNEDIFFIMWLNSQSASFTIPPGRNISKDEILMRYLAAYSELPLEGNEHFTAFIIEDAALYRPIGYLLLKMQYQDCVTGDLLGYIYDLAIHPDYWGKRATQRLMREAENMLAERGISYWMGDISIDNPRALKTALKSLRFQLESVRWLKMLPKV